MSYRSQNTSSVKLEGEMCLLGFWYNICWVIWSKGKVIPNLKEYAHSPRCFPVPKEEQFLMHYLLLLNLYGFQTLPLHIFVMTCGCPTIPCSFAQLMNCRQISSDIQSMSIHLPMELSADIGTNASCARYVYLKKTFHLPSGN